MKRLNVTRLQPNTEWHSRNNSNVPDYIYIYSNNTGRMAGRKFVPLAQFFFFRKLKKYDDKQTLLSHIISVSFEKVINILF